MLDAFLRVFSLIRNRRGEVRLTQQNGNDSKSPMHKMMQLYGIRAKKSLGQNFLMDASYIHQITEAIGADEKDIVVEIGPGLGALTNELQKEAGAVLALELDQKLFEILQVEYKMQENVQVFLQDALTCDIALLVKEQQKKGDFRAGFLACGNLPYYITTPIMMRFLESDWNWRKLVFMVQKEVAERMVAPPGGKDYGALSLAVQYHAQTELVTIVPPEVFYPQPKVYSAVIALHRLEKPPVAVIDEKKFFSLIKIAFAQRRKTLLNCLGSQTSMSKEAWLPLLEKAQINPQRRGETLSMQEFATLADLWTQSVG